MRKMEGINARAFDYRGQSVRNIVSWYLTKASRMRMGTSVSG